MSRLHDMPRVARHAAFWCCCAMVVLCVGLLALSQWRTTTIVHSSETSDMTVVTVHGGLATVARVPLVPGAPGFAAHSVEPPWTTPWRDVINPIANIRAAMVGTTFGADRWEVGLPLFVLSQLFALWPLWFLWRRWSDSRATDAPRYRSMVRRAARLSGLWVCGIAAFVASLLLVANVSRPARVWFDSTDAWTVWTGRGVVGFSYTPARDPASAQTRTELLLVRLVTDSPSRLDVLNPVAASRLAYEAKNLGGYGVWTLCSPLSILVGAFSLWPSVHVYRRWGRRSHQSRTGWAHRRSGGWRRSEATP